MGPFNRFFAAISAILWLGACSISLRVSMPSRPVGEPCALHPDPQGGDPYLILDFEGRYAQASSVLASCTNRTFAKSCGQGRRIVVKPGDAVFSDPLRGLPGEQYAEPNIWYMRLPAEHAYSDDPNRDFPPQTRLIFECVASDGTAVPAYDTMPRQVPGDGYYEPPPPS